MGPTPFYYPHHCPFISTCSIHLAIHISAFSKACIFRRRVCQDCISSPFGQESLLVVL